MYIIVIFLFSIIILVKLSVTKSFDILRMSFWLYISYSFLILTHLFSGIYYNTGSIVRILPYFLSCLLLIVLGEKLGSYIKSPHVRNKLRVSLKGLCIISFAGSLILILDILRLNEIRFGFRIVDMKISLIGVLGNVISSLGLIAWLSSLYEYRINRLKLSIYSYLALFSFVSGGLLSAGRSALMIISISSIILLLWSNRKRNEVAKVFTLTDYQKERHPFAIYFVLFLSFSYFLMISDVRSGISDIDVKINQFEKGFSAKTSKQTINNVHNMGSLSHIYIETLYYYSHELIRLDIFYQYYNYPPLFGLSQMGYVERRLHWLFGDQATKSWNAVEWAVENKGKFRSHTWGTFVTNFIMDFGRIGTLVACLLLGITVGMLFKKFKENENSLTVVRQVIICSGIVFSIQTSPVSELIWMAPFILSSFIIVRPRYSNS
jgi:hypothetical protein